MKMVSNSKHDENYDPFKVVTVITVIIVTMTM
jgi:hypothetical protein